MQIFLVDVVKRFGNMAVLERASLMFEAGRIVALLGPNGAGKTTLLRLLAAILIPDSGMILFDGEALTRPRLDLRRRFHFLPDFPFANPRTRVLEHMATTLRLYGVDLASREERAVEVLRDLDLMPLAEAPFGTLSRGQAYKAALAAMLVLDPELWLLDEPFASGMDPQGLGIIRREMLAAAERGRVVVYSTQLLEVARDLCHQFAVVSHGRVEVFERARLDAQGDVEESLRELFRDLRDVVG